MEASHVTLTDDEVRERFSAFHDGELTGDELSAVRTCIAENATIAAEYDKFKLLMGGLAGLAVHEDNLGLGDATVGATSATKPEDEPINILPGLQETLNKRSGGKFYSTQASRVVGTRPYELMAAATLVVLLITYVLMTYVSGLRPADPRPSSSPSSTPSSTS